MHITKCDICSKKLGLERIKAGIGFIDKDFCDNCGKPVLNFLKKNKLIKKEKKQNGKSK